MNPGTLPWIRTLASPHYLEQKHSVATPSKFPEDYGGDCAGDAWGHIWVALTERKFGAFMNSTGYISDVIPFRHHL